MREVHGIWNWRAWLASLTDPVRDQVLADGAPDLDKILSLFPRPKVEPVFAPDVITANIERLETTPEVNTGQPFLDLSVKTGLAYIDTTFQGDRPKYGTVFYGRNCFDPFPQTIIAVVDALTLWGLNTRAIQLYRYWLLHMVHPDGCLIYQAPCLGEYGQLLHTAAILQERAGAEGWWGEGFAVLDAMAEHVLRLRAQAEARGGLIPGSADEDVFKDAGRYFNTNAWLVRGLLEWADTCDRLGVSPSTPTDAIRRTAQALKADVLAALRRTWPEDREDWWLSPCVEPVERPASLTANMLASYTNYRYYPELLSSGILPPDLANRVVEARLNGGGQFCGMTRILDWLDDWPLAEYLYGLWALGRKDDFFLSLYGHLAYMQAEGHLTCCEQLTLPQGRCVAPYCLPSQLVAARAARLLVG